MSEQEFEGPRVTDRRRVDPESGEVRQPAGPAGAPDPLLEEAVEAALVDVVPLGIFAKPLVAGVLGELRAALSARIDQALNEYIQAQPTVRAGDGHAGLIEISET